MISNPEKQFPEEIVMQPELIIRESTGLAAMQRSKRRAGPRDFSHIHGVTSCLIRRVTLSAVSGRRKETLSASEMPASP